MNNSIVKVAGPQEGFQEVAEWCQEGKLNVGMFKVVVLVVGRADLGVSDEKFEKSLRSCVAEIRLKNPHAIIVFAATIPVPGDTVSDIHTSKHRSAVLARMASCDQKLEFSKPGKKLIRRPGGTIKEYFRDRELNQEGLNLVRRGIEGKINCGHLLQKYSELKRVAAQ